MKKILLSLGVCNALVYGATNEELAKELELLKKEIKQIKSEQSSTNESILNELSALNYKDVQEYESFSAMGGAASKVYFSQDGLSIGGYGEYKYTKYNDFKNYSSDTANETRNKGEFNIVRFVPYIGYKFNDYIIMNTEIEFEDGGARSDNTKNYKYAIVEFSYLDFLLDPSFNIRVGHILTPMGLTNLNHEPTSFLTADRPAVETLIIPSTWHTNGVLAHGTIDNFEYYAGVVTSPDAGSFTEGTFIQQGRLGARQFTDDFSFVTRLSYDHSSGVNIGGSFLYGTSGIAEESKPGTTTGHTGDADVTITMAEIHASYKKNGFDIQTLASYGALGGDYDQLPNTGISNRVNGQYITLGYDIFNLFKLPGEFYLVGEIERLDMDASSKTQYVDNNRFFEYTGGIAYYPDPRVVIKSNYKMRDYGADAKLADENSFALSLGFIF
ncbi:hypothetical protein [Sulfurimonas microaerophilic]|uniref:hypothetical protein n=1 Tax=Sulfurimonas microaerophilic TaxID=3058392 RepID=UPI002714578F|nr:hypothetical protein [Sulfurimonas sp. hsl 1-7]